jgi:hypothetical protein
MRTYNPGRTSLMGNVKLRRSDDIEIEEKMKTE